MKINKEELHDLILNLQDKFIRTIEDDDVIAIELDDDIHEEVREKFFALKIALSNLDARFHDHYDCC